MRASLKPRPFISRKGRQVLLVLATVVCAALGLVGGILAIFSPLVFDASGNLLNPIAWLAFILSAGFWAVCLLAPLLAWMEWRKDREPTAWAAMAAPLAWGAATVAMLQFVPT
jgi:hypothetical protein